MARHQSILLAAIALAVVGCGKGNVRSTSDYSAPKAPTVRNSDYDPNMPYGSANATWAAPVFNRAGTIVKPNDPSVLRDRPPYEQAPWATGAEGGRATAPPGTF